VIFGSLIGYSIYVRLLRDIGASRAGMYTFVSPVVAVLLGAAMLGETVTWLDLLGMTILLLAAWTAMSVREVAAPIDQARNRLSGSDTRPESR
jgi:drug/metabolite transporter (DMT)-like permease